MNHLDEIIDTAHLTDDELRRRLQCERHCALLAMRTQRELALARMRCLCREIERREAAASPQPSIRVVVPDTDTRPHAY